MNDLFRFDAVQERLTELYLEAEVVRLTRQCALKPTRQIWGAVWRLAHWRVVLQVRRAA